MTKNLLFISNWFSKFLYPMKILITSDNHLGFKENDDIRGNDSFNTFEEILMIARQENVDFIIQGGDLFHDNRPSRYCIDRTVQLLNKYCTGRTKSKHKELMRLNKMSENVSISIPIVAIHGNHDDPSGINRISTLNILHSAGLINYIGQYTADKIVIDPILVENVAIYGIGHIKDKLLYTSLIEGKVVFNKPNTQKKFYNILILHQNRVPRNKEHIPESLFDDKFDLIIYGHEHDNNITKGPSLVLQSGSTVRTSLCESETGEKYCYILEIYELNTHTGFPPTLNKIKLFTVRNFLMDTVRLDTDNLENSVGEILHKMIRKSNQEFEIRKNELNEPSIIKSSKKPKISLDHEEDINTTRIIEEPLENKPINMLDDNLKLSLIRLRVETNGLKIINNHRLGLKFTNLVANPSDMIRFIRKRTINSTISAQTTSSLGICEMIKANLNSLNAILEDKFIDSLENYTNKDEKEAFNELIKNNVDRLISKIDLNNILIDDLENEIKRINKEEKDKAKNEETNMQEVYKQESFSTEKDFDLNHSIEDIKDKLVTDQEVVTDIFKNEETDKQNKSDKSFIKLDKNRQEIQLDSLNSLSFISEENKDSKNESRSKSNISYLDANETDNIQLKTLESDTSTKHSFSGRTSKEARKMLNSINSESMSNITYLNSTLKSTENVNKRILFEEKKDEPKSPSEESSTDLLFEF